MTAKMGPCPKCKRHVFVSEERCPFCGARWGSSASPFLSAAAAASIFLGGTNLDAAPKVPPPVMDASAPVQETKYGGPRPDRNVVTWDRVFGDWETGIGLGGVGEQWAKRKPGTTVTYSAGGTKITATLDSVDDASAIVSLSTEFGKPVKKILTVKDALTKNATVKSEKAEELTIDGKKFSCTVKTYDGTGKTLNIWWCSDAPGGYAKIEFGAETLELVKLKETITVAGKKRDCSVWKTTLPAGTIREWRTPEIPGGVAKWEEKLDSGATTTVEVTGVSEK